MGSADAVRVADLLLSRERMLSTAWLLALDGPAGSGKTTLAREIRLLLVGRGHRAELVSLDDLYEGWTGLDETLEHRVLAQILEPLSAGTAARWQAYDWHRETFGRWHDLRLPDVLVLEGCGAGARRFSAYTSLLAWVEAPAAVRAERAVARDGKGVMQHWTAWSVLEDRMFTANATRARADIRVAT